MQTATKPSNPATTSLSFEERRLLRLLSNHTYDQIVQRTGWSRGRIYNLAIKVGARKTEARIQERQEQRRQRQVEPDLVFNLYCLRQTVPGRYRSTRFHDRRAVSKSSLSRYRKRWVASCGSARFPKLRSSHLPCNQSKSRIQNVSWRETHLIASANF